MGCRHRRVRLIDLLNYQQICRDDQRETLRELTADAQALGLYDRPNEDYQAALEEARAKLA